MSAASLSMLGRYRLVRCLGRGTSASVWEAVHVALERRVAIKILHSGRAETAILAARFEREGRAAARVRHPHVVDVLDVGESEGRPFLVMELVEGPTLATVLRDAAPMPVQALVDLMLPVMAAVRHAHDCGVVHRDLKPANILVGRDRFGDAFPRVTDFGISKLTGGDVTAVATEDGALVGTIVYMAPEQVRAPSSVDGRADQYALAVILYQGVTGVLPFCDDNVLALLEAIGRGDLRRPRELQPALPIAFEAALLRAMSPDRDERFPSVADFARALLPFASARAWGAYARDFAEAPGAREPSPQTRDEAPREAGTGVPVTVVAHLLSSPVRRASRWRAVAAASVLLACALAVASRFANRTPALPAAAPAVAQPAAIAATKAVEIPPPLEPTVQAAPPSLPPPMVVATASARRAVPPRSADAGAPSKPRGYEVGDHGAPIVE